MKIIALVEHSTETQHHVLEFIKDSKFVEEGWRVIFDKGIFSFFDLTFSSKSYYSIFKAWLDDNATNDWCVLSSKSIAFKEHSDAILFYMKFSAGVS